MIVRYIKGFCAYWTMKTSYHLCRKNYPLTCNTTDCELCNLG